ncbi:MULTISPECIES: anti-sigma regulatory factor [Herpetosiphon]|uniref:anti-sigma regulatory factor n=1 Tax=Herpetosiphon TaxID=64 RepID=UPI00195E1063|nr:anti-sigma regulatory factor [Herpetosiphon giganteus]MBM7841627.1 anti-sigma regulatory factor (Ser/Thr protein kinase) [Herpetosiphon giganteus]
MSREPQTQTIAREVDVYIAVSRGRELSRALGFDDVDRTRIEIAILELTRNILAHAERGSLTVREIEANEQRGIEIEASDNGPGIADTTLALRDGYSTKQTLGTGLPGVKRLMDEFEIESQVGVGTVVRARRWLPRRRERGGLK